MEGGRKGWGEREEEEEEEVEEEAGREEEEEEAKKGGTEGSLSANWRKEECWEKRLYSVSTKWRPQRRQSMRTKVILI